MEFFNCMFPQLSWSSDVQFLILLNLNISTIAFPYPVFFSLQFGGLNYQWLKQRKDKINCTKVSPITYPHRSVATGVPFLGFSIFKKISTKIH